MSYYAHGKDAINKPFNFHTGSMPIFLPQPDPLFSQRNLATLLKDQIHKMGNTIDELPDDVFLQNSPDDLIEAISQAGYIRPLELLNDQEVCHPPIEITNTVVWGSSVPISGFRYAIDLPYTGASGLFDHQPDRRGGDDRIAVIEVVAAPPGKEKKDGETWPERLKRLRRPIDELNGDASPAAIVALKENQSLKEALQEAQTPAPLRPPLTRALVDAWSMTSLEEHTGRPEIEPWLRGWVEDDQPQAVVVWRRFLPAGIGGEKPTKKAIKEFFDEAPPQTSEGLETETWRVAEWLLARVEAAGKAVKAGCRSAGKFLDGLLGNEPRKTGWMRAPSREAGLRSLCPWPYGRRGRGSRRASIQ